jgi:hypothetical protein
METPTFWLDEDNRYVWWRHKCTAPYLFDPEGYCEMMLPLYDNGWTLVSADPITITPSILCANDQGCGIHGFITDGKWVPA